MACNSDWVGALDHPVDMPLWDGISMAHPTDILVRLNESDTGMNPGSPGLNYI